MRRRSSDQMSKVLSCHCWDEQKKVGSLRQPSPLPSWEQITCCTAVCPEKHIIPGNTPLPVTKIVHWVEGWLPAFRNKFPPMDSLIYSTLTHTTALCAKDSHIYFEAFVEDSVYTTCSCRHTDRCVWTLYEFWLGPSVPRSTNPPPP